MELERNRQLLEGYRRGDHAALEAIYRHFSAPVLRSLSKGLRLKDSSSVALVSPLDLDAAHQETFVRVFGEAARRHYDGLRPFEPYVLAIARSAAIDVLRAQGKLQRHLVPLDELDERAAPVDPDASPEATVLRAEAEAAVRSFLATLSASDLTFATARFIEGLSQEKAGALCGLTRQQARTREATLKAACLQHLGSRGFLDVHTSTQAALTALVLQLLHLS